MNADKRTALEEASRGATRPLDELMFEIFRTKDADEGVQRRVSRARGQRERVLG